MSKNLKTQWRVQWRTSRNRVWLNNGLFETRSVARLKARALRSMNGLAFGNTRVVKYIKGQK